MKVNPVLQVALRVVAAACERRKADPSDIDTLKQYAPQWAHLEDDVLACEVVRAVLAERAQARATSA